MTNNKKRAARQCAVLLAVLATLSGCGYFKMLVLREELWMAAVGIDNDSYYEGLDLDPVRTITLPLGGGTYNILKWRGSEVLEIKCARVWPGDALYTYSRLPDHLQPNVPLSTEEIVDIYTIDKCSAWGVNVCAWIMKDARASYRLVGRLIWHGGRHTGPAIYVQCVTAAEFRSIVLSPQNKGVEPWTAPAWRRYLRRIAAEEAQKHPENEQATR